MKSRVERTYESLGRITETIRGNRTVAGTRSINNSINSKELTTLTNNRRVTKNECLMKAKFESCQNMIVESKE